MKRFLHFGLLLSFSLAACYGNAALHGFCVSPTPTCSDNGTITPVNSSLPEFGFWQSSGPSTANDTIVFLIPKDEDPNPTSVSFTLNSTNAGTNDATTIHDNSSLFSTTAWSSGTLESYLGVSATPANPIGNYSPAPTGGDTAATAYYAYEVNLGMTKVTDCVGTNCANSAPTFTISGLTGFSNNNGLPLGSFILDYVGRNATANSAALMTIDGPGQPPPPVPEPGSIFLLGSSLIGVAALAKKRLA